MQDITVFSGAVWDIIEITDTAISDPGYIYDIATTLKDYPFLGWQP